MLHLSKRYFLVLLVSSFFFISAKSQDNSLVKDEKLSGNWMLQSSSKLSSPDAKISIPGFSTKDWYKATVPSSTLGSLVNAGVFKNIFFAQNLEKISDSLFDVPWWYRTTFHIEQLSPQNIYRLRFNGISYRADIWLNGKKIASADTVKGSFRQFVFNVTKYIRKGENVLALKVTQAGPGELNIGFVDWNPEPPDNNMGIWRDVHLYTSGPVVIENPFVITDVDTATLAKADVKVQVTLHNYSDKKTDGNLKISVGNEIHLTKNVSLAAGESRVISFTPQEYQALNIHHPHLWWTHDLGRPYLYDLKMEYVSGNTVSDSKKIKFGIRSVSGYMTDRGFRGYKLNGKKILIKGGGWADPMLLNATDDYERAGIDYAVHMNLNTIRMEGFWGKDQHLYDLCDEKGILIMAGFSCQWEWKGIFGTPDDKYGGIKTPEQMDVAAESWRDQILWLRNHPSIFLWLYGSDKWPRPELELRYLDILKNDDPTRPYVQSAKEWVSEITGPTGMKMRGPYNYVPPGYWYEDTLYGGAFGFNTETGPGPQIPVLESLEKMIPKDSLWPMGSDWLYHTARGKFHSMEDYDNAMQNRLGKANNLTDYLRKAQYLNCEGMRAMFEAFEVNRFRSTGIIQWMYNSSWPKLWWQLYDFYLMPTGAFYGARKANEPLHICYDYGHGGVVVMNNTSKISEELIAQIRIYDFDMKKIMEKTLTVHDLLSQESRQVFALPENMKVSKTWFLDLRLFDKEHRSQGDNFYVLSTQKDSLDEKKSTWYVTPQSQFADLTLLQQLPEVQLEATHHTFLKDGNTITEVKVKNPSSHLAFMVYLDLKNERTKESVVPVFWSDNYFNLLPGEERTVSVYCHTADLHGDKAEIVTAGWNIKQEKSKP